MPAASLPASGSDRQYENIDSPLATFGRYARLSSEEADSSSGIVPSLLTAGISDDEAQARATSSMTIAVASASAPAPSYSSGTCAAWKSEATNASYASCGNRACASTSAAAGATLASHTARTASRTAWCSSDNANIGSLTTGPSITTTRLNVTGG